MHQKIKYMGQSEFIVALDLGTSKMIAMAGRKNEQGILSILAAVKEDSEACIRRGCVYNVEETSEKVKKILLGLNWKLTPKVDKVYLGIGGQSIRTKQYSVTKEVNGRMVDQALIDALYDECNLYEPEFAEILDIVSPEFYLDGRLEPNPKGVQCSKIEARFQLILGRPSLKYTLQESVEKKAGVSIAGFIISPLATAAAVLNDTEKELGCALIEFGAGVTYLSVYKGGTLKYLVTVPLGGNVITKDICDLNVLDKEAEELKINFGSALVDFDDDIKIQTAQLAEGLNNSREIELNKLNNIIEARMDEILANVIDQLKLSGYSDSLGAGIVITGGGASLKNLVESVRSKTGRDVRLSTTRKTLANQAPEHTQQPANSTVIGLLSLGTVNCAKVVTVEQPVVKPASPDLFGDEVKVTEQPKKPEPPKRPVRVETPRPRGGFFDNIKKGFSEKVNRASQSLFNDEAFSNDDEEKE